MDRLILSASIVFVLGLLHYSYLDCRARLRGGVLWFWMAWDKPVLLRVSNLAALASFSLAIASFFVGASVALIVVIVALFTLHVVTVEMLRNRQV